MANPITQGLPVIGELSYGGVVFEELLTTKVSGQPVWDRARRSVKYIRYLLEVDGYILSSDNEVIDSNWTDIRTFLQQPGLELTYSERGFGNFNINVGQRVDRNGRFVGRPTGMVDVCDGPHPEVLEFTPLGAQLASRVVWKCEICLPELHSNNDNGMHKGILAFNWKSNLGFGDDGYAEYTVEGELEIARVAGVSDNLENYRAYTEPQLPHGFKPVNRVFDMDEAKRTIQFSYSFQELGPMGIPVGSTKAGGSYTVKNKEKRGEAAALITWSASLNANYTVDPTGPRREAYMRFLGLLRDRMIRGRQEAVQSLGNAVIPVHPLYANVRVRNRDVRQRLRHLRARPIVQVFSINEGLYEDSRTTSFQCNWTFLSDFRDIFHASGAWRLMEDCAWQSLSGLGRGGQRLGGNAGALAGANTDVWASSMAQTLGYSSWYNYGFRPEAEIIVTPNVGRNLRGFPVNVGPQPRRRPGKNTGYSRNDNNRLTAGAGLVAGGVDPDTGEHPDNEVRLPGAPPADVSWLNYQLEFITSLDPGMALHKPLPQEEDEVDTLGSVDAFATNGEAATSGINTVSKSSGEDIIQRMATSTYRVALRGFGVRAGYHVPVPDLKVFGGVEVSPGPQNVVGPRIVANYSGVPIFMTAWQLWYDVPNPPTETQKAPPNIEQRITDTGKPPAEIPVPVTIPEPPIVRNSSGFRATNVITQ